MQIMSDNLLPRKYVLSSEVNIFPVVCYNNSVFLFPIGQKKKPIYHASRTQIGFFSHSR